MVSQDCLNHISVVNRVALGIKGPPNHSLVWVFGERALNYFKKSFSKVSSALTDLKLIAI